MSPSKPIHILIADDDEEDCAFAREALRVARVVNDLHFVHDGEELMDYLRARGRYAGSGLAPRPGLILLDIKMPKQDGFACLAAIKRDEALAGLEFVHQLFGNRGIIDHADLRQYAVEGAGAFDEL